MRGHTSIDDEGLIVPSSPRRALAPSSEDTLGTVKESSPRNRHSEVAGGREEKEEVADAARTVAGNNKQPLDRAGAEPPKTPKLRPAALPPSQSPVRCSPVLPKSKLLSVGVSTGLGLFTDTSLQPEGSEHNRNLTSQNATASTHAVPIPAAKVSGGLGMSYGAPELRRHNQQADYLRILQDKFDAPGPDRGHSYSENDEAGARNVEDGNSLEKFADACNEGYDGRHSLKSASHRLLSMLSTQASD